MLADVCEAVIAALYLDGGLRCRARFVESAGETAIEQRWAAPRRAIPRRRLQEWVQARGLPLPDY